MSSSLFLTLSSSYFRPELGSQVHGLLSINRGRDQAEHTTDGGGPLMRSRIYWTKPLSSPDLLWSLDS